MYYITLQLSINEAFRHDKGIISPGPLNSLSSATLFSSSYAIYKTEVLEVLELGKMGKELLLKHFD